MADYVKAELLDPFGTVVASGRLEVDADAITPAEACEYLHGVLVSRALLPGKRARLADAPFLPAMLAGDGGFTQEAPLNPNLAWRIRIGMG